MRSVLSVRFEKNGVYMKDMLVTEQELEFLEVLLNWLRGTEYGSITFIIKGEGKSKFVDIVDSMQKRFPLTTS